MAASFNKFSSCLFCSECAADIPVHFVSGMKEYSVVELWPPLRQSLIEKRVSFIFVNSGPT